MIACEIYDNKVREVDHFTNGFGESFIIINQAHWYNADKYTEESAIEKFYAEKDRRSHESDRPEVLREP